MIDTLLQWSKSMLHRRHGQNFVYCRYRVYHDNGTAVDLEVANDPRMLCDSLCPVVVALLSGGGPEGYWLYPETAVTLCAQEFVRELKDQEHTPENEDWPLLFAVRNETTGKWFVYEVAAEFVPTFYLTARSSSGERIAEPA